jgi:L-ribulose-5-phosphate 4-epimerase
MMVTNFAHRVLDANKKIFSLGLAEGTFGNASGRETSQGAVYIKPSGMAYSALTVGDLVGLNLKGDILSGNRRPSSDTLTHLEIYKAFDGVGGVVHIHSRFATIWAQMKKPIPCLGTTHADYFDGAIPVCRTLTPEEIETDYEKNTGLAVAQSVKNWRSVPAILVPGHGPFCWGTTVEDAVNNAAMLELAAMLAFHTLQLAPNTETLAEDILQKHHTRKHGVSAYYGQPA